MVIKAGPGQPMLRVGADRRVRPHKMALWIPILADFRLCTGCKKSPCRGGLPRPPAVTDMNVYAMNTTHVLTNIVYFGPSKLPILDGFTS